MVSTLRWIVKEFPIGGIAVEHTFFWYRSILVWAMPKQWERAECNEKNLATLLKHDNGIRC